VPKKWGSNILVVPVSAKKGVGARLHGVRGAVNVKAGCRLQCSRLGSGCGQRLSAKPQHGSCQLVGALVWPPMFARHCGELL
jgi:hypothetical protein